MSENISGLKVLLADDDEDDCLLFEDVLKELDTPTKLTCVSNGYELMRTLGVNSASNLPDILFLDLNMPLMNGMECLFEIKKNRELLHVPIIILSTSSLPEVVTIAYDNGADLYLRKPSSFRKLKEALKNILGRDWKNRSIRPSKEEFLIIT